MTTITNPLGASASAGAQTASKSNAMLDQNDFLKLMTTQLTTQDPFNPIDNQQMVAQMAQFSSVAGIAEMNKSLAAIAATMNPGRLSDAAGWIGRSMLTQSDVATPLRDGAYAGEITLPKDADQVTLSFVDANGAIVHTETVGKQAAGQISFAWDGKGADGEQAANGPLRVVVNATADGQSVDPTTATWTMIGGIQSPASGGPTQLVTGLGLLSPEAAIRLA